MLVRKVKAVAKGRQALDLHSVLINPLSCNTAGEQDLLFVASFYCFSPCAALPCILEVRRRAQDGYLHGKQPLERRAGRAWEGVVLVNGFSRSMATVDAVIKLGTVCIKHLLVILKRQLS